MNKFEGITWTHTGNFSKFVWRLDSVYVLELKKPTSHAKVVKILDSVYIFDSMQVMSHNSAGTRFSIFSPSVLHDRRRNVLISILTDELGELTIEQNFD